MSVAEQGAQRTQNKHNIGRSNPPFLHNHIIRLVLLLQSTSMNYDMTSRKLESTVENREFRSGYGDMHARRDADLMAEHVAHLRSHGQIDQVMATELAKPFDRDRKYTPAYLQTHPDYTGVQPDMPALTTADRHQKKRDKEMLKFVEDFEAGRIDEDGNPTGEGIALDATESGNDSSQLTDLSELEARIEVQVGSTTATSPLRPRESSSTPAPAAAPASLSSSSQASEAASRPKPRVSKRKSKVEPLEPSPGVDDYSGYSYYELLAVCRDRNILGGGDTQEVRKRLIQDDINVKEGLPRDVVTWKGKVRKDLKHQTPAALKRGAEKK